MHLYRKHIKVGRISSKSLKFSLILRKSSIFCKWKIKMYTAEWQNASDVKQFFFFGHLYQEWARSACSYKTGWEPRASPLSDLAVASVKHRIVAVPRPHCLSDQSHWHSKQCEQDLQQAEQHCSALRNTDRKRDVNSKYKVFTSLHNFIVKTLTLNFKLSFNYIWNASQWDLENLKPWDLTSWQSWLFYWSNKTKKVPKAGDSESFLMAAGFLPDDWRSYKKRIIVRSNYKSRNVYRRNFKT